MLRCKMRVNEVVQSKLADGSTDYERVSLTAVYGEDGTENAKWAKWTPAASFAITISNPEAFGKLSKGHEFFVDFTPVHTPAPAAPKDLAGAARGPSEDIKGPAAAASDSDTKEIDRSVVDRSTTPGPGKDG